MLSLGTKSLTDSRQIVAISDIDEQIFGVFSVAFDVSCLEQSVVGRVVAVTTVAGVLRDHVIFENNPRSSHKMLKR